MTTDLTFITNEKGESLLNRFTALIKDTRYFDCLVGYFYTSGFHSMYKSLESTEKIRILIGISTDKKTFDLIQESKRQTSLATFSHKETKEMFSEEVVKELNDSADVHEVEEGIRKFIDWLRNGKLEIRAYPADTIHAKLYIMSFKEGDRDVGRVITGSSNFTKSGLKENLEFNVELKNRSDYDFSLNKFNELWSNAVDVSEKYVETIKEKTWLNDEITPYELFLKFLYEYLKEKIQLDQQDIENDYKPDNFMDLEYQKDAVRDAKQKLEEYGGVFISDVVGLGKTFIATMLAQQLDGGTLVLAPPVLLDKNNPGSWRNVFYDFGIRRAEFESIGKLDQVLSRGTEKFKNVIIDEAHRFRTESTQMYETLYKICRGKRVILVSATPLNNTPIDILSQIKLFQNAHKSTLPNPKVRDLEKYFKRMQNKLDGLNRQKDKEEYLRIVKENAEDIRENVLQYLMVRRTRTIIDKYYKKDLEKQKFKFPNVREPKSVLYHFSDKVDSIFNKTLELVISRFKYSRYTPLLYLKEELPKNQQTPQKNMGKWMKILLLKRLESSFFAFRQSIDRFIYSYKRFIEEYDKGYVYVSERYTSKVFELLEDNEIDAVDKLIEGDKAKKIEIDKFNSDFRYELMDDLKILTQIKEMWVDVTSDPKLEEFVKQLKNDSTLVQNKLIVFTESKETAEYLADRLCPLFDNEVIAYSSQSPEIIRHRIIDNFDPAAKSKKNDVKILVTTEILSEGVNLNRSNVVINYDLPWNPIRMMQRVGRINRVAKNLPFNEIYTYNFFPAGPINKEISLTELAEIKIQAFIEMLGNDAKLLTDEDIKSHELFRRLSSRETIMGEDARDDPELEWLLKLREIRDHDKALFEKIKRLPKKARTAKKSEQKGVITFFKKGKLRKTYLHDGSSINEIDFEHAVKIIKADKNDTKEKLTPEFYKYLEENKKEFDHFFMNEGGEYTEGSNRGYETQIKKRIKALLSKPQGLTDDDEDYLQSVLNLLKEGALPKSAMKRMMTKIKNEINPLKILASLKSIIPIGSEYFQDTYAGIAGNIAGPKEIILSEMLIK
ncbi:helicase [Candidatus Peregrinibacteria bacterium RIFOXYB2_FULL_32_7]|nr:MAG: helicase [Candidatus Peregrinibacteria bacterium RIFOXYB2_FULL_32_7]